MHPEIVSAGSGFSLYKHDPK